ncbi:PAS domain-containing protein [Hymenobacter swuensis]|uniref:PAS domain-containing protein n=1 Tax=Hymenobacter swuensis DY53 TaxID=1227739 RepID=W8F1C6_9BACT|nr:PAS domain-containing protein [Hymenobacter swuensis]AHJ97822.1 hypothetical protein Hsw_2227 [Hymenobacter swuensis DY53]
MTPDSHVFADLFYAQAQEFVGVYDPALGWFTGVNLAGVRLLGYPSEQVLLADPSRTLPSLPWTAAQWQALYEQTRRTGRAAVEVKIRRYVGPAFWARVELAYCETADTPFFMIRLVEQRRLQQAERELAQSERRFEAVFANATLGIIVCDQAGDIVSANQLAGQLFGYSTDELLGQRAAARGARGHRPPPRAAARLLQRPPAGARHG